MSFDEVWDQLTLERYNSLQRFWMKHPPTAVLLAGYVGYKGGQGSEDATDGSADELDDEGRAQLEAIFGPMPQRKRKTEDAR